MGVETILTLFWLNGAGMATAMTSQEYKTADACNVAGIALKALHRIEYECTDKYTGAIRTAGK
jgi:hypothetical protein